MAFNNSYYGEVFTAGDFLANNEDCTRITDQFNANDAKIQTLPSGKKIIPAGTVFSNGIVYEDVDVTNGDAAGSVVIEGVVYEDRLPEAVDTYSSATVPTGGNPKELGLYERSGTSPNYVYTLTTDTTATEGKTYYSYGGKKLASATKTALEALGIKFVTEPTVTRPEE